MILKILCFFALIIFALFPDQLRIKAPGVEPVSGLFEGTVTGISISGPAGRIEGHALIVEKHPRLKKGKLTLPVSPRPVVLVQWEELVIGGNDRYYRPYKTTEDSVGNRVTVNGQLYFGKLVDDQNNNLRIEGSDSDFCMIIRVESLVEKKD